LHKETQGKLDMDNTQQLTPHDVFQMVQQQNLLNQLLEKEKQ